MNYSVLFAGKCLLLISVRHLIVCVIDINNPVTFIPSLVQDMFV